MNAAELIHEAETLGINLWVDSGKLKYKAPQGVLVGQIKDKLINKKPEIISFITQQVAKSNLHGQTLDELKLIAGDDWPRFEANSDLLESLAKSVASRKLREQGQRPSHYTKSSYCFQCGPVWLWNDAPDSMHACPWCFNRVRGVTIPRPQLISCSQCRYFKPNDYSPGAGMGGCQKGLNGKFAEQLHDCSQFNCSL